MSVKHECCCGAGVKKEADKSAPIGSRLALPTPGDGRLREGRAKRRGQFSRVFSSASQSFLGSNFGKSFQRRK